MDTVHHVDRTGRRLEKPTDPGEPGSDFE